MINNEFKLSDRSDKYKQQIIMLVQIACEYESRIEVEAEEKYFNAKSIMRIGELKIGDKFRLNIDGVDEEIAMRILIKIGTEK